MRGERLRVTVGGRDAADLVPIEEAPAWTSGARVRELLEGRQADARLAVELAEAFPDTTDDL